MGKAKKCVYPGTPGIIRIRTLESIIITVKAEVQV